MQVQALEARLNATELVDELSLLGRTDQVFASQLCGGSTANYVS